MALSAIQIANRARGIGGSDAAAVIGVNPYRTPYDVWLEKIGAASGDRGDSEASHFGRQFEPILAEEYTRRTGRKVRRVNRTLFSSEHPHMLAHLDRVVVGERRIVEIKTASLRMAHHWGRRGSVIESAESEDAPAEYITQVHHQMIVHGSTEADLAVLIGGNEFRIYPVVLDPDFAKALIALEHAFWHDHVLTRKPPEAMTLSDLAQLYPKDDGKDCYPDPAVLAQVRRLKRMKGLLKRLEAKETDLIFLVKNAFGAAQRMRDATGRLVATLKHHQADTLDRKQLQRDFAAAVAACTHPRDRRNLLLK